LLDRLIGLRNDLGLLSEEYDPVAGRLVGNFPQAFSHVSLVNSASKVGGHEKPTADHMVLGLASQSFRRHRPADGRHMSSPVARSMLTRLVEHRDRTKDDDVAHVLKRAVTATGTKGGAPSDPALTAGAAAKAAAAAKARSKGQKAAKVTKPAKAAKSAKPAKPAKATKPAKHAQATQGAPAPDSRKANGSATKSTATTKPPGVTKSPGDKRGPTTTGRAPAKKSTTMSTAPARRS
jgi:hypothetical protein